MSRYQSLVSKIFQRTAHFKHISIHEDTAISNPRRICQLLGNPFQKYPCIHVTGTNGKGSVCTKIASVLQLCNYKIGLMTSPHISCARERIAINEQIITESDFCDILENIFEIEEKTNEQQLSFFELMTVLSFEYFAKENVDFAVIEVGLGGRNDATNIITQPALSVITSIALDHTLTLGNTIEAITAQKCGIIKNNCPTVIGPYVPLEIVQKFTTEKNSDLTVVSFHNSYLSKDSQIQSSFMTYDQQNQVISHQCLQILANKNLELSTKMDILSIGPEFQKAMEKRPLCRMQEFITDSSVTCVLDGAHNLNGMFEFFKAIRYKYPLEQYSFRVVFGMCRDKNVAQCLSIIMRYANAIHFVSIGNHRALSVEELFECYEKQSALEWKINENDGETERNQIHIVLEDDIHVAVSNAVNECRKVNSLKCETRIDKEEILLVCGSLYIMGTAREQLGYIGPKDMVDFTKIEFVKMP